MDYRNADGSIAQMCGNGVRVFAHYLRASGLESRDEFVVGSLAGPRPVVLHQWDDTTADVTVEMGKTNQLGTGEAIVGGRPFAGLAIDVGNPHLACVDPDLTVDELAALDVAAPVSFDRTQFPDGVNVEVLTAPHGGAVSMRVHERGVGETRSCGTGTVAAAVAALAFDGATTGTLRVCIPGGEVTVAVTDASSYLRGPSVLVAQWRAVRGMVACCISVNSGARYRRERANLLSPMTYPNFPVSDIPSAGELALEDRAALRRVAGSVDRTRRRLRGRVPAAAAGARRAGRRVDRRQRRRRRGQHGRARRARRDRGLRSARGPDPTPRQAGPVDLHRLRQGAGAARGRGRPPAPTPSSATAS